MNYGTSGFRDRAEKIIDMTGSTKGYVLHDLPEDDPQRRCPDISFAKENLDWEPNINLSEGISTTLDWFRKCIND
mgnify:CR=1 FL=1